MKTSHFLFAAFFLMAALSGTAREYHVSKQGNDAATGSIDKPFRTVNAAAQIALPGDTVTVHQGIYREWVDPLRGGSDPRHPILYRAAEGETVEIKGSEEIKGWKKVRNAGGKIWSVTLPNSMFGTFNPFAEVFAGDWLDTSFTMHMADVFINDKSLYESESPDSLMTVRYSHRDPDGCSLNWYATVGAENTVVTACFEDMDPNAERVEISVRPTCFYPTRQGLGYITVRGFKFSQAATRWAAPTAEQVGMVAPHWSKGWIIEDNVITNSKSSGITLGKEAGTGNNACIIDPEHRDGHIIYIECIFSVLKNGWNKENIGSHIVRNNIISDCGQAGISGSMGCAFCEVYGNTISNICIKDEFGGAEMAGIKFHCGIDAYIHENTLHNCIRGIWLDWMGQGSRISSNILYDNICEDLFLERDHGPYIVDNNILLSDCTSLRDNSEGGAYIHNLFSRNIAYNDDPRFIPYMLEHSTTIKGVSLFFVSDNRFIDNIFVMGEADDSRLSVYNGVPVPVVETGNVTAGDCQSAIRRFYSSFNSFDGSTLDLTYLTKLPFTNPDGTSIISGDTNFLSESRDKIEKTCKK